MLINIVWKNVRKGEQVALFTWPAKRVDRWQRCGSVAALANGVLPRILPLSKERIRCTSSTRVQLVTRIQTTFHVNKKLDKSKHTEIRFSGVTRHRARLTIPPACCRQRLVHSNASNLHTVSLLDTAPFIMQNYSHFRCNRCSFITPRLVPSWSTTKRLFP